MVDVGQAFQNFQQQINAFFVFVGDKLKNFKTISRGEQISYVVVGTGMILVLVSLVLFAL